MAAEQEMITEQVIHEITSSRRQLDRIAQRMKPYLPKYGRQEPSPLDLATGSKVLDLIHEDIDIVMDGTDFSDLFTIAHAEFKEAVTTDVIHRYQDVRYNLAAMRLGFLLKDSYVYAVAHSGVEFTRYQYGSHTSPSARQIVEHPFLRLHSDTFVDGSITVGTPEDFCKVQLLPLHAAGGLEISRLTD